jgi:hypothetical protein
LVSDVRKVRPHTTTTLESCFRLPRTRAPPPLLPPRWRHNSLL